MHELGTITSIANSTLARAVNYSYDYNAALAKTFTEALNRRDLDDFLSVLAEDVELRTVKGVKRGRRAAAAWFARPLDHLELEFNNVNLIVAGDWVVGTGSARFTWRETGEVAEEAATSAVWKIENGLVRRWEAFSQYTDALSAAGILPAAV